MMDLNQVTIIVKKVKPGNSILAQATLIYECIEIHGFTIATAAHRDKDIDAMIYIQPPRQRAGPYWKNIAYFNDENVWREIKIKIFDQYHLSITSDNNPL